MNHRQLPEETAMKTYETRFATLLCAALAATTVTTIGALLHAALNVSLVA